MTEHRTMNTIIHAAFRRDLARFTAALESFPAGSKTRADQLGAAWENFAHQLHHHHEDEETIFWPTLRGLGADETIVGDLGGEHARMLIALDAADTAMRTFCADPTEQNTASARSAIAELRAVLLEHLEHEERDLEPLTAELVDSPQMKVAAGKARQRHKGHAGTFMAWLLDGADADAAAGLRSGIPAPVLFVLTRVGGRDYNRRIATVWT